MVFRGGGRPDGPAARGGDLGLRVASGIVMAAAALLATWLGGVVFAAFWLAAGIAIALEWITIARAEPRAILVALSAAGMSSLVVAYELGAGLAIQLALACLAVVAIAASAEGARDRSWAVAGFGYALLVAVVPSVVRDHPSLGIVAILWMFGVVWTTDIAAYFAGRALGGPKLAPWISPKKTWSGFIGGLVAATAVGTLVFHLGAQLGASSSFPASLAAVASAIASVASQVGDLGESAMKRRFDVKDSGSLIPGHGGVMDRLDGFAAVALLCGVALAGSRLTR